MKIALDVFGGDNAPESTIDGAMLACKKANDMNIDDFTVTLVGDYSKLKTVNDTDFGNQIDVLDVGGDFYNNASNPQEAGRAKNSPIRVALRLHKKGEFDAVVSAGSTGAQVVASLAELGSCAGVKRPAIGSLLPTSNGFCFLLDVGASLVAGPKQLVQFAVMGYLYSKEMLGIKNPRLSLLNVGKESGVGPRAVKTANKILNKSRFDYIGYIEGRDILAGEVDVIVTNGLIGNILLKYTEGFPKFLREILPDEAADTVSLKIREKMDYERFGGEPLLGIKGVSVIGHGASSAHAISSALIKAGMIAKEDLHSKIDSFMKNELENFFPEL